MAINGINGKTKRRNGTMKSSAQGTDRTRPVLSATVPAALREAVEREVRRRGLPTLSAAVEQLLVEALCASEEGRRGDIVAAQLQRLNLRLAGLERELQARDALIVELLTTLTRTFLAHTPPPDATSKEELKRSASERFERLMRGVQRRVEAGDDALAELLAATPELAEDSPPHESNS